MNMPMLQQKTFLSLSLVLVFCIHLSFYVVVTWRRRKTKKPNIQFLTQNYFNLICKIDMIPYETRQKENQTKQNIYEENCRKATTTHSHRIYFRM